MKKNMDGRRMVPYNVYRMTLHCAMTLHNARLGRGVCGAAVRPRCLPDGGSCMTSGTRPRPSVQQQPSGGDFNRAVNERTAKFHSALVGSVYWQFHN